MDEKYMVVIYLPESVGPTVGVAVVWSVVGVLSVGGATTDIT